MLAEREGRWLLKCNECPVRMDLAPAMRPRETLRMPTGWMDLGDNAHVCMQCARARWGEWLPKR